MKKIFAITLCLLVVLSCAASAFAAEPNVITVTPSKTQVAPGDTIDFIVTVKATDACRTAGIVLQYDAAIFEVVDGKCSSDDALIATFDKERGFIILFAKAVVLEGELCTFTMKVRDAAATDIYEVGVKTSMKDKEDPIEAKIEPASITVVRPGDAVPGADPTEPSEEAEKPTEPPKATEKPTEPKETEPKETEPKETEPAETEESTVPATEATEATEVTEPTAAPTDAPTEPQPTVTEPAEPTAAETQSATEAPTEPAVHTPEEPREFEFPKWAIPVYAIGFALIIIILILKRRLK